MCLSPIRASLPEDGGRPFIDPEGCLKLPCGKCFECISKRASEWAIRAKHEISEHSENCFLTLTYDDEHLKSEFIIKEDFQKFMKSLRNKVDRRISYMVSYEYGGKTGRPHCHAIIFGYEPENQTYLRDTPSGYPLFTSPVISKLWKHGYHSIADANAKTAYYIASYALKGSGGESDDDKNDCMDVSKAPAIGLNYFLNNYKQIFLTLKHIPRYYIKVSERIVETRYALKKLPYIQDEKEYEETVKQIQNTSKFLKRCNKTNDMFHDLEDLLLEHEQKMNINLRNRSNYEILAKFTISNQKNALHSSTFREDYKYTKENLRRVKNRKHEERLKDEYRMFTQIENSSRRNVL